MGVQLEHQLFTYENAYEMGPETFRFTGVKMTKTFGRLKAVEELMSICINYSESRIWVATLYGDVTWEADLELAIVNERDGYTM